MNYFRKFVGLLVQTMALKDNWIFTNLLWAAVFFVVLLAAAGIGLNLITRHGKTVTTPDFTNLTLIGNDDHSSKCRKLLYRSFLFSFVCSLIISSSFPVMILFRDL